MKLIWDMNKLPELADLSEWDRKFILGSTLRKSLVRWPFWAGVIAGGLCGGAGSILGHQLALANPSVPLGLGAAIGGAIGGAFLVFLHRVSWAGAVRDEINAKQRQGSESAGVIFRELVSIEGISSQGSITAFQDSRKGPPSAVPAFQISSSFAPFRG